MFKYLSIDYYYYYFYKCTIKKSTYMLHFSFCESVFKCPDNNRSRSHNSKALDTNSTSAAAAAWKQIVKQLPKRTIVGAIPRMNFKGSTV